MDELIKKLKSAIELLEKEAPLLICAIFLREEPLKKWDFIVAATWLDSRKMEAYTKITSALKRHLSESEFVQLSRIVILDSNDLVVSYLQNQKTIDNGGFHELNESELSDKFGFAIKKAYLLRSQKDAQ
jgi:hypothetical protein